MLGDLPEVVFSESTSDPPSTSDVSDVGDGSDGSSGERKRGGKERNRKEKKRLWRWT